MSLPEDPQRLLDIASGLLDGVHERFVAGVGAPSAVQKGPDDFATAVDLELEKRLTSELFEHTGIEVHGEEFGGPDLHGDPVWVLDPIDGTFNYSAGLPSAGTLLALLDGGVPVLALTWLPLVRQRFTAIAGGPLRLDGEAVPRLEHRALGDSMIGFGAFNIASRGRIPGLYRVRILEELSKVSSRLRMHGATGVDLAYTASGVLGGCVVFGHRAWDNAAGALMVQAAGGVVTDLAGAPWTVDSTSVLAGSPGVHEELSKVVASLGDPKDFLEGRVR
ncbi:inositol monophosphatase [Rhodococcus sp. BP-252]|uniref:inositol monophosphatase family protein n=1 Tax=unclassified Rhodococcus (in: high G+C Gram-positive bacteria) TaxID=192944 RepID=UPI001C9AAC55|nr:MULTISPECIES: inositol monophosphatase [unclassified Rhodococcus (in: high G+C Gram-positive bacteria)]MBY6411292.1 inositol monophosphatase [Rhodococcus sp. BP-320]MBY6415951.1 inositol monophosphatase [Rhodococcus sp. BP-321]MBY6420540.1 inositol monophosphatase [Rhodococcus sp. BP-324]MBY6426158.1 inositol monophosphatase [Rhodococcus sp. BP-323]MBY6431301.1 inositol monophosphatase [Rhodococcus sp. BP-322]